MTDSERSVAISQAAGRLAKARRAWLEATASTQAAHQQLIEAERAEREAATALAESRRAMELAAYDSEAT
jgi:hypothetical protein